MQAVILVGGEGTRLRPLTYDLPKPMVPIFGKPYLEHLIDHLKKYGVRDIILSSGYKVEEFEKYFKDGRQFGVNIYYAIEASPLGTAGAVKNAEKFIKDKFLVFNGDVLSDVDLGGLFDTCEKNSAFGALSLYWVEDPTPYGLIETDEDGRIKKFIEKPSPDRITTNYINAGIYFLEKKALDYMPSGENYSFEKQFFPDILKRGLPLYAYKYDTYWIDIGSPQKYLKIHKDFLGGKIKLTLDKCGHGGIFLGKDINLNSACIIPPVFIDDGCVLEEGITLGPMAIIGKNCRIKKNASLSDSLIWEKTIVEEKVAIKNSIVGRNCIIFKDCTGEIIGSEGKYA